MSKRKQLSKKIRFSIFKRDNFTCQYCGNTPPKAVLEVDHISPVKLGGDNDPDNLITSCFDCNRGKAAEPLDVIPQSLDEKMAIAAEKEEQIAEYKKTIARKKRRQNAEIKALTEIFSEVGKFTSRDILSIKTQFLPSLPYDEIEDSLLMAISKFNRNPNNAWKYFCGICWNKIKGRYNG